MSDWDVVLHFGDESVVAHAGELNSSKRWGLAEQSTETLSIRIYGDKDDAPDETLRRLWTLGDSVAPVRLTSNGDEFLAWGAGRIMEFNVSSDRITSLLLYRVPPF